MKGVIKMVNRIPTYDPSIDPVSIAHISSARKTAPTPLVQSARDLPPIVDIYGAALYVSDEAKKAAKMYDSVKDFKLKNKYNFRELFSCHTKASELNDSINDGYVKGSNLKKK